MPASWTAMNMLAVGTLIFVLAVYVVSTCGFVYAGWPFGDAAYMVLLTVFSVGYGEIRPVDTLFLRWWTSATAWRSNCLITRRNSSR